MKAIQKIMHFLIILAVSLASSGFRVPVSDCFNEKTTTNSAHSGCCCSKPEQNSKTSDESCGIGSCVLPASVYWSFNSRQNYEQVAKLLQPAPSYRAYTEVISLTLQAAQPYFSLPPPHSGRFKGILHQIFII
ncbi:hypothetical protein [Adhaeribacter radiodurans]|uniref:Uncharacterized protein n=1 Tax=Adhaeribacter radiodurans TaxID=2745197 RepID=A0A7L7L5W6_9BACT|nr:hypothetical protein [Adhaeribacter radiodurans]QMU28216.1 hypothetical protein HUW48_09260 [Adhaeribacter radiodurans]